MPEPATPTGATPTGRAVVTGASRGLGCEWVRQLMQAGWHVVACARDPQGSPGLAKLAAEDTGLLALETLDVTDTQGAFALAAKLRTSLGGIDLLVNNAGVNRAGPDRSMSAGPIDKLDVDAFSYVLQTNTVSPLMMTKAFAPLLAGPEITRVVNTASRLGSLTIASSPDDPYEHDYGYRISKAALSMVTIALANDLKSQSTVVISMSPGFVRTDMTGARGDITVEESVSGQVSTALSRTLADTGKLFAHTGETIPW